MRNSVAVAERTTPDKLDVIGRPKMAKATTDDNLQDNPLSPIAKEAVKTAWGSQEAAAAHLQKDKGNFSRDVDAERMTLAQMRQLGPSFLAAFGSELLRHYGTALETPEQRAKRIIRSIRAELDELDQYVEHAS